VFQAKIAYFGSSGVYVKWN